MQSRNNEIISQKEHTKTFYAAVKIFLQESSIVIPIRTQTLQIYTQWRSKHPLNNYSFVKTFKLN